MDLINQTNGHVNVTSLQNGTGFMGDFNKYLTLNCIVAVFYVLFVLLPSLFFNGSVLALIARKKDLQTPLNLLTVNQCISGILSNFINPFLFLVVSPIALNLGSCVFDTINYGTVAWTHYGIVPMNIAAIAIAIYVTLRFGPLFVSYKKVIVVIVINWLYSGLWAIGLSINARDIRSHRCLTFTNTPSFADGQLVPTNESVRLMLTISTVLPSFLRDILVDYITRILVVIFTIASYRRFKTTTINPSECLTKKMLLLPVLMTSLSLVLTLFTGVFLLGIYGGFGDVSVSVEEYDSSPLFYAQLIAPALIEYDALAYAFLLLYFNSKIQLAFKLAMKGLCRKVKDASVECGCRKPNKILPMIVIVDTSGTVSEVCTT